MWSSKMAHSYSSPPTLFPAGAAISDSSLRCRPLSGAEPRDWCGEYSQIQTGLEDIHTYSAVQHLAAVWWTEMIYTRSQWRERMLQKQQIPNSRDHSFVRNSVQDSEWTYHCGKSKSNRVKYTYAAVCSWLESISWTINSIRCLNASPLSI